MHTSVILVIRFSDLLTIALKEIVYSMELFPVLYIAILVHEPESFLCDSFRSQCLEQINIDLETTNNFFPVRFMET